MVKKLFLIFWLLIGLSFAQTVTFTGGLNDITNTGTGSNAFVRVRLRNFSGNVPRVIGSSALVPTQVDYFPNASGLVTGSILCNVNNGVANITPLGTFYTLEFWFGGKMLSSANFLIDCAMGTFNFNTASPLTTVPVQLPQLAVLQNPTANQTIMGSNLSLTLQGPLILDNVLGLDPDTFANLPNPPVTGNGTLMFCTDCQQTSPCSANGTGTTAQYANGQWQCFAGGGGGGGGGGITGLHLNGFCQAGDLSSQICTSVTDSAGHIALKVTNDDKLTGNSGTGGLLTIGEVVDAQSSSTVSGSASFDAHAAQSFKVTITGDVTSSTLTNLSGVATLGETLKFEMCPTTSAWNFVWPTNVIGGMDVLNIPPGQCATQTFRSFDGTNAYAMDSGLITHPNDSGSHVADQAAIWLDVKAFGAKGDAAQAFDASTTAGSPTLTTTGNHFLARDVGKVLGIDQSPVPQPTLPSVCSATNAAKLTCDHTAFPAVPANIDGTCNGGTAGTIDTTAGERAFFYRFIEHNSNGDGTDASFEGWILIPSGSATNCVKIAPPSPIGTPTSTSWKVYAALDCCNPFQATHNYTVGNQILDSNGYVEQVTSCSGACTSAGSAPAWPQVKGQTTVSNLATFTNEGYRKQFVASGAEAFQSTATNCASGNPSLPSGICELDAVSTGGAAVPSPNWLITQIKSVNAANSITMGQPGGSSVNATNTTSPNAAMFWATDDRPAISRAVATLTTNVGGGVVFPPGSFYVSCPGVILGSINYLYFRGAGTAGSKNLGPGAPGTSSGSSEVVTGENCPIWTYGTSGSQIFSGMGIEKLGHRDLTQGNGVGAILAYAPAHFLFRDSSVVDFFNGYGITFNAVGASGQNFSQFNEIDNANMVAVHDAIIFTGNKSSEDWIHHSTFAGSEVGGGRGLRFDANNGSALTAGGADRIDQDQFLYFPITTDITDHGTMELTSLRGENSSNKQVNIAGGSDAVDPAEVVCGAAPCFSNFGVGVYITATQANPAWCSDPHIVSGSMNLMHQGYVIDAPCTRGAWIGMGTATADFQVIDQSASSVALNGAQGLVFHDSSGNITARILPGSGAATFGGIVTTGNVVDSNTSAFQWGGQDSSTGSGPQQFTLREGDWTGTGAYAPQKFTIRSCNSATTDAASGSCDIEISAGQASASTASGPFNGDLKLERFWTWTSGTAGAVLCFDPTNDNTIKNCATSATNQIGVGILGNTFSFEVRSYGTTDVLFDVTNTGDCNGTTCTVTRGDRACTSANAVGTVQPQSTACADGRQIGIFPANITAQTHGTIWIQIK